MHAAKARRGSSKYWWRSKKLKSGGAESATASSHVANVNADFQICTVTSNPYAFFCNITFFGANDLFLSNVLIDTGSPRSFVSMSFVEQLQNSIASDVVLCASGVGNVLRVTGSSVLKLQIGQDIVTFSFVVVENLSNDAIIGLDFLFAFDVALKIQNSVVQVRNRKNACPSAEKLIVYANVYNASLGLLVDSGASCSCISEKWFQKFAASLPPVEPYFRRVADITGLPVETAGTVQLTFAINNASFVHSFVVTKNLQTDAILGYDWLCLYCDSLDVSSMVLKDGTRIKLCTVAPVFALNENTPTPVASLDDTVFKNLPRSIVPQMKQLFSRYLASLSLDGKINTIKCEPFRILLDTDAPIAGKARYRYSFAERVAIDECMDVLVANKCVEPSTSLYDANVVLDNKNGKYRMCIDYKPLNKHTVKFPHVMPRFEEMIDCMRDAVIFSKFDLTMGYHQMALHPADVHKTAFTVQGHRYRGKYQWLKLPFGVQNGPMFFQATMENILRPILWNSAVVNVDDCLVFSKTVEEHPRDVETFLQLISANNIMLKPAKLDLGAKDLEFVGHRITTDGVQISPSKMAKMADHPVPQNRKELLSFLQFANFLRKHTPYFAQLTASLYKLSAQKKAPFVWTTECQAAFEAVKKAFLEPPVLAFPDPNLPYRCYTDASFEALGAVLCQEQNGVECVIACASRVLTGAENNYSATQLECLAVHWCLTQPFRQYVFGSKIEIVTDHAALVWLFERSPTEKSRRLRNWIHELSEYDLVVVHCPGSLQLADSLSRAGSEEKLARPQIKLPAEKAALKLNAVRIDDSTSWQPASVRHQQLNDPELGQVFTDIETKVQPQNFASWKSRTLFQARDRVVVLNGMFMIKVVRNVAGKPKTRINLIVPSSLRLEVLKACHNAPVSGHLGIARTVANVKSRFWWPGLFDDVKQYCSSCDFCLARKSSNAVAPVTAKVTTSPFVDVHIDIVGEIFPHSAQGHRYVLSLTDAFSKLVTAYPIRDKSAKTVARMLTRYCSDFDIPINLISDCGGEFENDVVATLCESLGIKKKHTVPYNPRANGQEERSHRTFIDSLAATLSEFGGSWSDRLPLVVRAYNTTPHSVTGISPIEVIRGFPARNVGSLLCPFEGNGPQAEMELEEYVENTQQELAELWKFVQKNIEESADRRTKQTGYSDDWKEGDLVYRKIFPAQSGKFKDRYDGPYRLITKIGPVNWKIQSCLPNSEPFVENINKLKLRGKNPFFVDEDLPFRVEQTPTPVPYPAETSSFVDVPPLLDWENDDDSSEEDVEDPVDSLHLSFILGSESSDGELALDEDENDDVVSVDDSLEGHVRSPARYHSVAASSLSSHDRSRSLSMQSLVAEEPEARPVRHRRQRSFPGMTNWKDIPRL